MLLSNDWEKAVDMEQKVWGVGRGQTNHGPQRCERFCQLVKSDTHVMPTTNVLAKFNIVEAGMFPLNRLFRITCHVLRIRGWLLKKTKIKINHQDSLTIKANFIFKM